LTSNYISKLTPYTPELLSSNSSILSILSKVDYVKEALLSQADKCAFNLDSSLLCATDKVKSLVEFKSSFLFKDFIRLSYSNDNEILRVVMRWIYETCRESKQYQEGIPNPNQFYQCFVNDPMYGDEGFKKFIFKFCECSSEHWKLNITKDQSTIIKQAMKMAAFVISETKLIDENLEKSSSAIADTLFDIFD